MNYGLQVFDESGNATVNSSDRIGRILGSVVSAEIDGSITHEGFLTGTPFYLIEISFQLFASGVPVVSFLGDQMSWEHSLSSVRTSVTIFYGVY